MWTFSAADPGAGGDAVVNGEVDKEKEEQQLQDVCITLLLVVSVLQQVTNLLRRLLMLLLSWDWDHLHLTEKPFTVVSCFYKVWYIEILYVHL